MTIITRWDPFQDLHSAQDEIHHMHQIQQIDRLFAQMLGQAGRQRGAVSSTPAWAPALNISERTDAYLVTVELPGVDFDDVEITLEQGLLTIRGERPFTDDPSEQFHRVERRYGPFRRSITLPAHVMEDAIHASAHDGVLQILVPKMDQVTPKRIKVSTSLVTVPPVAAQETPSTPGDNNTTTPPSQQ
jgi:HSP20 family protein